MLKTYLKKAVIVVMCVLYFVGCDQSTKQIAKNHLEISSTVTYLGGLIRLIYVENSGAMLSLGSEFSSSIKFFVLIIGVSVLLSLLLIYLILKKKDKIIRDMALIMVLSGGLGNLTDRIMNNGKVIDFIIIGTEKIHTAVFNFADVFIMFGTLLFVFTGATKSNPEPDTMDSSS